jgi:hypothetical protein
VVEFMGLTYSRTTLRRRRMIVMVVKLTTLKMLMKMKVK